MKKLIFFGLIAFILAGIWFIPLAFVAPHLSKITNDVTFKEPQGTIWNGKVNHLKIKQNYIGATTWRLDPLKSLKSLSLKTKFTIASDDINANGLAGITWQKNLAIDNSQFDINAEYFNILQNKAKLSGNFYRAVIQPVNKDLDINLSSKEAPIELNGIIKLQNNWKFDTNLSTKSNNAGLMAMMKFAGKPQKDGTILIKQKGDLKPFIGIP